MPKAAKTRLDASTANGKQITDFFPRKLASTPQSQKSSNSTTRKAAPAANQPITSLNTSNAVSRAPSSSSKPLPLDVPSTMQSATKRLRSQSIVSPRPNRNKRPKNVLCNSNFAEDSMDVVNESVVYVKSEAATVPSTPMPPPVGTRPKKKLRHSHSPELRIEIDLTVPSSVPEERELEVKYLKHNDIRRRKESVNAWRKQDLPPSPSTNASSPIDESNLLGTSQYSSDDLATKVTPLKLNTDLPTIPTPPLTESSSYTQPTLAVDADTRARQAVEEIRARAFAAALSSSGHSSPLSSLDSLDSSDDDEGGFGELGLTRNVKPDSPVKPSKTNGTCQYNLRKKSAPPKVTSLQSQLIRKSNRVQQSSSPVRQKLSINPLDALLKDDSGGRSKTVVGFADREERLRRLVELNLDDSDNELEDTKTSPDDNFLNAEDGNPFIHQTQKEQVLQIFQGNKDIEEEEEKLRQRAEVGVPFWTTSESYSSMVTDESPPSIYEGMDPVLRILAEAIAHGDASVVDVVLQSGALGMANYLDTGSHMIEYLCRSALSPLENVLSKHAFEALLNIWGSFNPTVPELSFNTILYALRSLGADSAMTGKLGWVAHNAACDISDSQREICVDRLVHCIRTATEARKLVQKDIPDVATSLLLVAIEPSTTPDVRLYVQRTIHEVCQSIGDAHEINAEMESAICNTVLRSIASYSLKNKAYALSFFASGSGRTARIARYMAHAMLTDKAALLPSCYSALPPLSEIIYLLTAQPVSFIRRPGKFEISEHTDYGDLSCWTSILAIAINDITGYVDDEKLNQAIVSPQKSPSKKNQSPTLEIHNKLLHIHGRIQDTRAAHLDRSATKAIIYQTAFRIYYQHQATTQYRKTNSQNIHHYFGKK